MKQIVALIILLAPMLCRADFVDGNKLNSWAEAHNRVSSARGLPSDAMDSGSYFGYVVGVADALGFVGIFCPAPNATAGQMMAIVQNHLKNHPEEWTKGAQYIVIDALRNAFPCRATK